MHESAVTADILKIVLRYARLNKVKQVRRINLQIGELSDLEEEWIQHYFDKISIGTVAEKAKICVERAPCVFLCNDCNSKFSVDLSAIDTVLCPRCGSGSSRLLSGDEYLIKNMEAM